MTYLWCHIGKYFSDASSLHNYSKWLFVLFVLFISYHKIFWGNLWAVKYNLFIFLLIWLQVYLLVVGQQCFFLVGSLCIWGHQMSSLCKSETETGNHILNHTEARKPTDSWPVLDVWFAPYVYIRTALKILVYSTMNSQKPQDGILLRLLEGLGLNQERNL